MTLRRKLILSQLPLAVVLTVITGTALYAAARLGAAPSEILDENFRSFDAGQRMLRAVERIDERARYGDPPNQLVHQGPTAAAVAELERELQLQEGNITEAGEQEVTAAIRAAWTAYRDGLGEHGAATDLAAHRARSRELRAAVDRILTVNRDAMLRKSAEAEDGAKRIGATLTAAALAGFMLALGISGAWLRRITAPVRVLERAVDRMARGDFDAKIRIEGDDEIASLSRSFNDVAEHLARYQESSLGELLELNNRLESVMDSLGDAVIVYDIGGTPTAYNEVAERFLGASRIGLDALPQEIALAVRGTFESVRRSGEPLEAPSAIEVHGEVATRNPPRWLLVSATPVFAREGSLSGVTVALRDVTRARRIEGFKGDLVAAAADELRTPLTSLHMAVHLCLERAAGPLTDRQSDLLAAARRDCEGLQSVVEELLDMARLESGAAHLERANVYVSEIVRDTAARHEARARHLGKLVEVIPGDSLLTINVDIARIRHVLDNLVDNAFVHAGGGGRVQLGYEESEDGVRIYVDDDGVGVPADLRGRVFTKFFRVPGTPKHGSGLGLSIVQDVVHAHGGEVGVERSPLGGARFWFSIPRAAVSLS